jgi:predicted DNA binding CopG/RHH family protein
LSQYDQSDIKSVSFEFQPKDKSITMRLPETLVDSIKKEAERLRVPYQRFIRQTLENALHYGK